MHYSPPRSCSAPWSTELSCSRRVAIVCSWRSRSRRQTGNSARIEASCRRDIYDTWPAAVTYIACLMLVKRPTTPTLICCGFCAGASGRHRRDASCSVSLTASYSGRRRYLHLRRRRRQSAYENPQLNRASSVDCWPCHESDGHSKVVASDVKF